MNEWMVELNCMPCTHMYYLCVVKYIKTFVHTYTSIFWRFWNLMNISIFCWAPHPLQYDITRYTIFYTRYPRLCCLLTLTRRYKQCNPWSQDRWPLEWKNTTGKNKTIPHTSGGKAHRSYTSINEYKMCAVSTLQPLWALHLTTAVYFIV